MRSLLDSIKLSDLVEGVDTWGQPSVKAEDLVLNHSSQGQVVEKFGELLPNLGVSILSEAFIVESIPTRERPRYSLESGRLKLK